MASFSTGKSEISTAGGDRLSSGCTPPPEAYKAKSPYPDSGRGFALDGALGGDRVSSGLRLSRLTWEGSQVSLH